jgi:hypothetical protein
MYEIIFRPHEENFASDKNLKADDRIWSIEGLDGEFDVAEESEKLKLTIYLPKDPEKLRIVTRASNKTGEVESSTAQAKVLIASPSAKHVSIVAHDQEDVTQHINIKWPYAWFEGEFTWVLLNEESLSIIPILTATIFCDICLLLSFVSDDGNGVSKPEIIDSFITQIVLFVPPVLMVCYSGFCCILLLYITDRKVEFADIIAYKANQFGVLTGLQSKVASIRRNESGFHRQK